jgi:hypothetical protein
MRTFYHSCESFSLESIMFAKYLYSVVFAILVIQFCPTSLIYFSLSRFYILSYLDSTRTSAFVGLVAPFSCGHFSMHAGLSAALRTCVTHSLLLVVVQATDVSYRTRRNDAARLQRERTGDNGTDGTRDRKVAVSNA